MLPLSTFLQSLLSEGKALVGPGPQVAVLDENCGSLLSKAYHDDSWHFPGPQPPFDQSVAIQAALWFYKAAMCYADRSMTAKLSEQILAVPRIERSDASAHYSVDLVLRHLPALLQIASGLASDDPILTSLKRMAWVWPLASVGVKFPKEWRTPDLDPLRTHAGLWRWYLDRIIAADDPDSIRDEATLTDTRLSLGLHPELSPRLQPHWQSFEPSDTPNSI